MRVLQSQGRFHGACSVMTTIATAGALGLGIVALRPFVGSAQERVPEPSVPFAPPGTAFSFEVIESHDADYLGDTPAHLGRNGGLTVRPHVALGDAVYRTDNGTHTRVGRLTHVVWSRVTGSLELEFDPEPLQRVAVGDEVWIDLNPALAP